MINFTILSHDREPPVKYVASTTGHNTIYYLPTHHQSPRFCRDQSFQNSSLAIMLMLSHYIQRVRETDEQATNKLRNILPFGRSRWKKLCVVDSETYKNTGHLLRTTLLSGGCLYMPLDVYHKRLPTKVLDLEAGVVTTDVEIAHNIEGIRLFFELDYRSDTAMMPTFETMLQHLRVVQDCVRECYPSLGEDDLSAHVAFCPEKVKYDKTLARFKLARGAHIVFPAIIGTTQTMRLIAQLVDCRLTKQFPSWSNVVDPSPYRSTSATLRPLYSHKAEKCTICTSQPSRKRRREDGSPSLAMFASNEHDGVPRSLSQQLAEHCTCSNGYIIQPSVYTYYGTLIGERLDPKKLRTREQQLHEMSIIPTTMGLPAADFHRTPDMGDEKDRIPVDGIVFPSERQAVSGFKRRHDITIPMAITRDGCRILHNIITKTHAAYKHATIDLDKVRYCSRAQTIRLDVRGCGSRHCLVKKDQHSSNRVFFVVNMRKSNIAVHCFKHACRQHIRTQGEAPGRKLACHEYVQLVNMLESFKPTTIQATANSRKRPDHLKKVPWFSIDQKPVAIGTSATC
jgi:phage-related protein